MDPRRFHGIYAATLCPMRADATIDEEALVEHIRTVTSAPGLRGLLVNGHAGENFALEPDEKRRVVELARAAMGAERVLVAGVNAEDSRRAAREGAEARDAGADAIMVFPPFSWALSQDADMALRHHEIVDAATHLPIFLYQAGVGTRDLAYTPVILTRLARLERVVAIKEGSWETARYEENRRLLQAIRPELAVMASGDEHLFTCFVLGSEGSLVSLAAVAPELVIDLDRAVATGDLARARALHERIYPLARAIYNIQPGGHATARLKACLKLLGRLPEATCRPPMGPLPASEITMLEEALAAAGVS